VAVTTAASTTTTESTSSPATSFELSQTIVPITTTSSSSNSASSEQQSGDELPISTQALITGRGGTLSPARIRVPPFIAVTLVLHAADSRPYSIVVGGRTLSVGGARSQASVKLPGLKPQGRYVATVKTGSPSHLVIVASAEPGP
jgi:hypothetical protein